MVIVYFVLYMRNRASSAACTAPYLLLHAEPRVFSRTYGPVSLAGVDVIEGPFTQKWIEGKREPLLKLVYDE